MEEAWASLGSPEVSLNDIPRTAVECPIDVHDLRHVMVEFISYDIIQKEYRVRPRRDLSEVSRIDYEYMTAKSAILILGRAAAVSVHGPQTAKYYDGKEDVIRSYTNESGRHAFVMWRSYSTPDLRNFYVAQY